MLLPGEKLYMDRLMRRVQPHLAAGSHVLDAGCGIGKDAEYLLQRGFKVTAIDIEQQPGIWPELCRMGITCQEASAEALPYADGEFDAVWVKDALHHMQHPEKALQELMRVVKPGGVIVVIEANRFNPVFYLHLTLIGNHQHFTRRKFKRMMNDCSPGYLYYQAESRCLPWHAAWILQCLVWFEDALEALPIFKPWLTYQIAILPGRGRACSAG